MPSRHRPNVQQTGTDHLYVIIQESTGVTVETRLAGSGPSDWSWPIVCNLCGETTTIGPNVVGMARAGAEVAMLNHADQHRHHDPDGGPDAGFGGYGWGPVS